MIEHETATSIDAPPCQVWKHLIDFERHADWTRHFRLSGAPKTGERGAVAFALFGRPAASPVVFQKVVEERELRWQGGPKGLVSGNHYFILEGRSGGRQTQFRHRETFSGLFAPLVWKLLRSQLGPAYAGFNEDLKRRVEGARPLVDA